MAYALLLFCHALPVDAQTYNYKYSITHRLILSDFTTGQTDKPLKIADMPRGMEISFSKFLKPGLQLNVPFRTGFSKGGSDTTGRTFFGTDVQLQFEYAKKWFIPYLSVGLGAQNMTKKWDLGVPLYGGIQVRADDAYYITLQAGYRHSFKPHNSNWQYSIGMTFRLKPIKSSNSKPVLPQLPQSDTASLAEKKQEVMDYDDSYSPELSRVSVLDPPLQTAKNMDTTTNKAVSTQATMDTDNDGVLDSLDKCPTVFGLAQYQGCPAHDSNKKRTGFRSVYFETNKTDLSIETCTHLDQIAEILHTQPTYHLNLQGHTDNEGPPQYNDRLGLLRAKKCRDYLVSKGINITRLSIESFGEMNPLWQNETAEGRALNRCVDFVLSVW